VDTDKLHAKGDDTMAESPEGDEKSERRSVTID
jgi:hypothetical protein